nr:PAAR-like domain-containing protein [Escherichia fergusonii]
MADNVAARKDSDWFVVYTTPDVCKTPMGSSTPPIPYRVTAKLEDAAQPVPSVNANGKPVVVLTQSFIPKTIGDEKGTVKGVQSGTVGDICEPLEHSSSVKAAGFYVLRHDDEFHMNCKNTIGKIVGQSPSTNKSASESNPEIVPETPAEKGFWDLIGESYIRNSQSQIEASQALANNVSDFVTDNTDDGIINSGLVGAMMAAGDAYSRVPGASDGAIPNIGGEAAKTYNALNTPQVRGLLTAAGAAAGGIMMGKFDGVATEAPLVTKSTAAGSGLAEKTSAFISGKPLMTLTPKELGKWSAWEAALGKEGTPEMWRRYAEKNGGPEALAAFDKTYNPAYTTLSDLAQQSITISAAKTGLKERSGAQIRNKVDDEANADGTLTCTRNCNGKSEPVDIVTGDFLQHLSVLTVPGTLPLTLTRLYRSRSDACGLFGPKWTDEWSCFLELDDHEIHFTDHEGVTLTYPLPRDGLLKDAVNSRVSGYVLSGDVNGELRVFDRRSQQHLVFGEVQGQLRRLSTIHDGYGNSATFIYRDERLVQVRHSDGHVLDLAWPDGQLAMITLTAQGKTQRLVTCRHDDRGMLAECDSFQFSHRWHRYSPEGFMVFWQDADGTQVDLRYDMLGRVTEIVTPEGYFNDRFIYNEAERQSIYLDAEGGQTLVWYNEDGLTVREADPLGRETLTVWENHRRKSVTDALGRVTEWDYNRHGDIIRLSLPGGITLHYRYDDNGNLTRFQGPGNKVWLFDYDEHGGLLRVTDPQGRQGSRLYGDHGELLQQVLPDGETWRYGYDPLHRLSRVEDPLQGETLLAQDMLGRLLEVRDPLRQVTAWQHSTQHASPEGSVTQTTLPDGVVQRQAYSAGKKVASFTDGEGKTTRYEYGSFDRVMAVIRPDGQRYAFEYDGLLRLTQVTDAEGKTWRYDRDLAGQVIRETDFTGRVMAYEYDAAGRRTCTRHPDGHLIRWYYDHGDRLLRQQVFRLREGHEQPGAATDYAYDTEYRLISATPPDARVAFEYDADGNVTAETVNGHRVEHSYDPLSGRPVAWRLDGVEMAFTWGAMGRLAQWQVNGHAPLRLSHNALGREIKRHSDAGFLHGQRHSETGNLIEQWAGRMEAGSTTLPLDVSRYMEYDRAYNITHTGDRRWGDTRYHHDLNDQITLAEGGVRTLPREEAFSYDASLNLTRYGQTPNRHYEVMQFTAYEQQSGRVTQRGDSFYRYDECGRRVEKNVLRRGFRPEQWRYRWDDQGQLQQLITPQGERWQYRYDAFGRRISKRRQDTVKGIAGYDYCWSGDQLVAEVPVYADGTAATDKSVYWLYEPGALTPGARYENGVLHYVVRDHVGTPRELLAESGEVVWAQKLSVWGRSERYPFSRPGAANDDDGHGPDCPWRFAGQWADEESGLYYNRFRYYDSETTQYVSPDPIGLDGGYRPYGYVHNPLGWIDPLGLVPLDAKGYSVYALFDGDAKEPYYVGITNDVDRRKGEHIASGRLTKGAKMKVLDSNITYGQARGYEQYYIDKYRTKTGVIDEKISETNRGNKINSFDQSREDLRALAFKDAYNSKKEVDTCP